MGGWRPAGKRSRRPPPAERDGDLPLSGVLRAADLSKCPCCEKAEGFLQEVAFATGLEREAGRFLAAGRDIHAEDQAELLGDIQEG